MRQKLSLHVGVNEVDAAVYPKRLETLRAAEADARAMHELAVEAGLTPTMLLGPGATRTAVSDAIRRAATALERDDLLVLTFSGHGAIFADLAEAVAVQRPPGAVNRLPGDEPFDQSWCLRDGVLIDDDLHLLLCDFHPGVRIYVLTDSCYSGTILRFDAGEPPIELTRGDPPPAAPSREVGASVLLSAAASDTELTYTTVQRGLFTKAVLDAWDGGRFEGDHRELHARIQARSALGQVPPLGRYGARSAAFETARPFGR